MTTLPGHKKERHVNIQVFGNVQGVFFRRSVKQKAETLGLNGFVRNEPDGTVYMEAESQEDKLKNLINWLEKSPEPAEVTGVETEYSDQTRGFYGFEIR